MKLSELEPGRLYVVDMGGKASVQKCTLAASTWGGVMEPAGGVGELVSANRILRPATEDEACAAGWEV